MQGIYNYYSQTMIVNKKRIDVDEERKKNKRKHSTIITENCTKIQYFTYEAINTGLNKFKKYIYMRSYYSDLFT